MMVLIEQLGRQTSLILIVVALNYLTVRMTLSCHRFSDRLLRRRTGIFRLFFPALLSDLSSNIQQGPLIWVHGVFLRRFVSCNDPMDDILSRNCLLHNRCLLCNHGRGLHPRVARTGKLLPLKAYNILMELLQAERLYSSDTMRASTNKVTDLMISTVENLYCSECEESYRSEMRNKLNMVQSALQLYDD